jgi:ParB/RepB/Spo0J family partition protein
LIEFIESLLDLQCRCEDTESWEADFWVCVAIGAAHDLGSMTTNYYEALSCLRVLAGTWPGPNGSQAVCGEVNQYLSRILGDDEMATATKRKQPSGSLSPVLKEQVRDHALKLLCCPTASDGMAWAGIREAGISDEELYQKLIELWQRRVFREMPPCAASSGMGSPLVWFGTIVAQGTPSLSGDELVEHVRRVMNLPLPINESKAESPAAEFAETKPNGKPKPKAKEPQGKVSMAELLAGVEVIEERDVAWNDIKRSKQNPRLVFDPQLIEDMEPNIENICRVNPITLREGSLELIDGETRHRAGEKRKPALRCKIIRCTDAQAAAMRLLTSVQRRDLNPIEKASALKSLQEQHGLSQRQLEELVKLKQGTISNMTRLLDLPEAWQQRVISGEITPADARELVPWRDEPAVLKHFEKEFKSNGKQSWFSFTRTLRDAVYACSMKLKGRHRIGNSFDYVDYHIKPTDEQRQQLRIRTVKFDGGSEERALNQDLCKTLIEAIVKKKAAAATKKKDTEAVTPEKAKENAKKQQEILAKKLYRFRVGWHQAMCRHAIAFDDGCTEDQLIALLLFVGSTSCESSTRRGLLQKFTKSKGTGGYQPEFSNLLAALMSRAEERTIRSVMTDLLYEMLDAKFTGYHNVMEPAEIEALAECLGISISNDWSTSFDDGAACADLWDGFCDLWSKDQMLALLDEWKIKRPEKADSMKRSELAKLLSAAKPCPKAILNAKPVRLT